VCDGTSSLRSKPLSQDFKISHSPEQRETRDKRFSQNFWMCLYYETCSLTSKIVTDNIILEQVNMFTYLGCKISYEGEKATLQK